MRMGHIVSLAAVLGVGSACLAQDEPELLRVSDPAIALDVAHWLKGNDITEFHAGQIYVIEFWATDQTASVDVIPQLSALQEQFKDYGVRVVGITDESPQNVVKFLVRQTADGMLEYDRAVYSLASDPDLSTRNAYCRAAGVNSLPMAFIIGKEATIEWIGSPNELADPLEQVVKGVWDRAAFKATFDAQQNARFHEQSNRRKLRMARADGDWESVIEAMDALSHLPRDRGMKAQKYQVLGRDIGDEERANAYAAQLVESEWDDATVLNSVAWFMVDDDWVQNADLDLAMKAADRANELTNESSAAILDTVARVHFEQGRLQQALKWQRKAVDALPANPQSGSEIRVWLEKYEKLARGGA